jgi:tRNA threonylcarbamoyladenosine biosynthesis protein TsaB
MRLGASLSRWIPKAYPHARDVACLGVAGFTAGAAVAAEAALPVYIRDNVAAKARGR